MTAVADWLAGIKQPVEHPCPKCTTPTFFALCEQCECERVNTDRRNESLRNLDASIPDNFRRLTFTDDRVTSLDARAVKLADALLGERFVALVGPLGAGKTTLAAAMLRTAVTRGTWGGAVHFGRAHRLGVARIQHAAGKGEAEAVEEAMNATLLLLDDVGNEHQTSTNAVPDVLLERYEEGRATWVTTWLTPKEAAQIYGGGVARRIFEQAKRITLGVSPMPKAVRA